MVWASWRLSTIEVQVPQEHAHARFLSTAVSKSLAAPCARVDEPIGGWTEPRPLEAVAVIATLMVKR